MLIISFNGIDGSGKTIHAFKLYQELKADGFKCEYIHFESLFAHTLLNKINKIINSSNSKCHGIKDSHKEKKSSFISMVKRTIWPTIWPPILIIDDIFFYLLKIRKKKGIVICDRYFYDSAISCIYSGAGESFIHKVYQRVFPLPDMMFLMDVEPKIAYCRKEEDSLEYLTHKRELYLKLYTLIRCKKIKVDSSHHFDQSFTIVRNKTLEILEEITNG